MKYRKFACIVYTGVLTHLSKNISTIHGNRHAEMSFVFQENMQILWGVISLHGATSHAFGF
jgi:hypothetical protein